MYSVDIYTYTIIIFAGVTIPSCSINHRLTPAAPQFISLQTADSGHEDTRIYTRSVCFVTYLI